MNVFTAKILNHLPESWFRFAANKMVNYYLGKYADIKVDGMENIKKAPGAKIFICNHLSNSDGLILDKVLKEYDPYFVAGVKLSNDPVTNIGTMVVKTITIKPNSADKEALTRIVKAVKEGSNLVIFPEGTRSRTGSMIEAKKGILLIAKLTKAPIVPIGMSGTDKLLPIDKEGDMAKETWHNAEVRINIGEPITFPNRNKEEDKNEYEDRVLNYMMKSVARLLPEEYRGYYR